MLFVRRYDEDHLHILWRGEYNNEDKDDVLEDGVGHAEPMRCDEKFTFFASANG